MAEPKGRPKTLVRRHVLEIREDTREWIEETIASFTEKRSYGRNSRVIGAAITAAGVYTMTHLVMAFGRAIPGMIKNLGVQLATEVSFPIVNVFLTIFGIRAGIPPGEGEGIPETETTLAIDTLKELGQFDPFAFGAALTAGGLVLSGINPGEVLQGIGSIIDALIPL